MRLKCFKRCHDIRNNDTSLKDIQYDQVVPSIVTLSIVKNYNKCSDKCINLAHYAKCHYAECCYAECCYAECRYSSATMLCVVSVVIPNVFMLSVVVLSVAAPSKMLF